MLELVGEVGGGAGGVEPEGEEEQQREEARPIFSLQRVVSDCPVAGQRVQFMIFRFSLLVGERAPTGPH